MHFTTKMQFLIHLIFYKTDISKSAWSYSLENNQDFSQVRARSHTPEDLWHVCDVWQEAFIIGARTFIWDILKN